jgi:hypothetical protein
MPNKKTMRAGEDKPIPTDSPTASADSVTRHTPGPWAVRPFYANDETLANARLIAAAPDLLSACKVALLGGAQDFDVAEERRAIVRAAIDKAEGR